MERYHEASYLLDHSSVWPKKVRILPKNSVLEIRKMNFIRELEYCFAGLKFPTREMSDVRKFTGGWCDPHTVFIYEQCLVH